MDASRQLTWSSTHHRLSLKIISPVLVLSAYSIISPPKPGRCRSLVLLSDDAHWNKTRSPGPGPWVDYLRLLYGYDTHRDLLFGHA